MLNNFIFDIIDKILNEVVYNFISLLIINFLKYSTNVFVILIFFKKEIFLKIYFRVDIVDAIFFA